MRKERGITLISLVITIIILVILAAVAINFAIGENGIITKAQEAKRLQAIAAAKEQIGLEILEAQIEAMRNNEELEQSEVETIVAKYGVLQADGDTIILNDSGYELSLSDIYNTIANTETDGDSTTELAQLKALLSQTTVTEDKILKDYKAYKDGRIITGTMENYAGQTVEATTLTESGENAEITIPQNGYYTTESKISVPVSKVNSNLSNSRLLYWYGTEYNFDTSYEIVNSHGNSLSITSNDDNIRFYMTGKNDGVNPKAYIRFNEKIDLTNVKELVILGHTKTSATAYTAILYAGVSTFPDLTTFTDMEKYTSYSDTNGYSILKIDVSELTGEHYLYIGFEYTYAGASYNGEGLCYSILAIN